MEMRVFDLQTYEYEDFIKKAKEYAIDESTFADEEEFLLDAIDNITKTQFKGYSKAEKKAAVVVDGTAREEIPIKKRLLSFEDDDCAFIIY